MITRLIGSISLHEVDFKKTKLSKLEKRICKDGHIYSVKELKVVFKDGSSIEIDLFGGDDE